MYRHVWHSENIRSAHTAHVCVLNRSQNKQQLFPYSSVKLLVLVTETDRVYLEVRAEPLYIKLRPIALFELLQKRAKLNGSWLQVKFTLIITGLLFVFRAFTLKTLHFVRDFLSAYRTLLWYSLVTSLVVAMDVNCTLFPLWTDFLYTVLTD
jgi:hypothetical protein